MEDVQNLITAMKNALPLYAYPEKTLVKELPGLRTTSKIEITDVYNMGIEGGISCAFLKGDRREIVSITHLNFTDEHPLRDRINNYKFNRIKMLTIQHILDKKKIVGRNAECPCGSGKKYKHCCGK